MKDNLQNNKSDSIYHFTKMETGIEYILPEMRLRLSPLTDTNDPQENKTFGFMGINAPFSKNSFVKEQKIWNKKISSSLRNGVKVICFSMDYNYSGPNQENEWFDGYNLPRMWSQYGGNHSGFCFDINRTKFINLNSIDEKYFKKIYYRTRLDFPAINYDRIKEIGFDQYIEEYRNINLESLFFEKNIDWLTEREIRLLKFSQSEDDEYMDILSCINRIILGINFKIEYLPSVIRFAQGIPLEKIEYENQQLQSRKLKKDYIDKVMSYVNRN